MTQQNTTIWSIGGISTHILTKRMTVQCDLCKSSGVFQLTSSRRGWHPNPWKNMTRSIFQLTSSRRGWPTNTASSALNKAFQLTSSRRGWRWRILQLCSCDYFNSHPHEEDDRFESSPLIALIHFNSHPHEEDDNVEVIGNMITDISTHILTKRMTEDRDCNNFFLFIFQLTSSRRGWRWRLQQIIRMERISTHILTKRMTDTRCVTTPGLHISTHILTKRMTRCYTLYLEFCIFQLTSSRRGWQQF